MYCLKFFNPCFISLKSNSAYNKYLEVGGVWSFGNKDEFQGQHINKMCVQTSTEF